MSVLKTHQDQFMNHINNKVIEKIKNLAKPESIIYQNFEIERKEFETALPFKINNPLYFDFWLPSKLEMNENNQIIGLKQCLDYHIRNIAILNFGWSIPSNNAILKILEFTTNKIILNACSGAGYWSYILKQMNQSVVSVDKKPNVKIKSCKNSHKNDLCQFINSDDTNLECIEIKESNLFVDTFIIDINEYLDLNNGCADHVLFVSWPRHLNFLSKYKGDTIIWIGEYDGCTGFIDKDDSTWVEIETINIPQFSGLNDYMAIYKRRQIL